MTGPTPAKKTAQRRRKTDWQDCHHYWLDIFSNLLIGVGLGAAGTLGWQWLYKLIT